MQGVHPERQQLPAGRIFRATNPAPSRLNQLNDALSFDTFRTWLRGKFPPGEVRRPAHSVAAFRREWTLTSLRSSAGPFYFEIAPAPKLFRTVTYLMPGKTIIAVAAAALALLSRNVAAQSVNTQSPFMPEGSAATATPTENAPLELRGIVATKSGTLFALYDPTKRQSVWVGLNEQGSDYVVKSYDANNDMVTVEYQGRSLTLPMKASKVESLGPIAAAPVPMPNMLRPGQPGPGMSPSPADEARRLESVAAEVRRRRMMRQAAQSNQQQQRPAAPAQSAPGAGQPQRR